MSIELNDFELLSRLHVRFASPQGELSVEDLWDLPLTGPMSRANLNDIAKALHTALVKEAEEVSFVPEESVKKPTLSMPYESMLSAVKRVIAVKVAERDAAKLAREKKEEKDKLLAALDEAETRERGSKTSAEIREMIAKL